MCTDCKIYTYDHNELCMPFPWSTLPSTDHWQAFRDTYIEHVNKEYLSKRISILVSSLTMANRRSPLRLTYVEPVLGYDRYLSHLSAQLPQPSTLPSAIFVSSSLWRIAIFCARMFSVHIDDCCRCFTAELVHILT